MRPVTALCAVLLLLLVGGCGGSESARRETAPAGERGPASPDDAESTFNPSDYGIETWEEETPETDALTSPGGGEEPAAVEPDTLPGFRVQATITGDIDDATTLRDSLSTELREAEVYVVYHPPYYKIRVGDFIDRFAAGEMLERLRRGGFPDAWIVPDRVLRNPPPKPEIIPDEPTAPPDTLR